MTYRQSSAFAHKPAATGFCRMYVIFIESCSPRLLARHRRQSPGEHKSAAACKGRVNSTVCVIPYEREIKAGMTTSSRATDATL